MVELGVAAFVSSREIAGDTSKFSVTAVVRRKTREYFARRAQKHGFAFPSFKNFLKVSGKRITALRLQSKTNVSADENTRAAGVSRHDGLEKKNIQRTIDPVAYYLRVNYCLRFNHTSL